MSDHTSDHLAIYAAESAALAPTSWETCAVTAPTTVDGTSLVWLRNATLGNVEDAYHRGSLTQDVFEGFMHSWSTSAVRFSNTGAWARHEFATPAAERVAVLLGCCGRAAVVGPDRTVPAPWRKED